MISVVNIVPVVNIPIVGARSDRGDSAGSALTSKADSPVLGPKPQDEGAAPTSMSGGPDAPVLGPKTKAATGDLTQVGARQLTPDQVRLLQDLAQTDQKVRAHEAAHQAAAGSLGGAVSYTYETGPDGRSYAVAGEVSIDLSAGRTAEETISRAEQIRSAALAPSDPSPQDLAVASQASQMEAAAQEQLMQQQLAVMHKSASTHTGQAAVPGAQSLRARDVKLSAASAAAPADSSTVTAASADAGGSDSTDAADAADSSTPDVGAQSDATIAVLETDRATSGVTVVQVQQLARLATAAYSV